MKPMIGSNYGHPGNEGSVSETVHPELHDKARRDALPHWKRAHHSWVFWIGLFLMLSAAMIYVLSDDLALLPGGRPQHAPPNAVER
jgi:hypothetical protein